MNEVQSVASTSSIVGNRDDFFGQQFQPEGSNEILTVKSMVMDNEFAGLLDLSSKRVNHSRCKPMISLNVLMNETAVKTMGLADPVGRNFLR